MSYDVQVGEQDRPGNITYNVDRMFAAALGVDEFISNGHDLLIARKSPALERFKGRRGDECVDDLRAAVGVMEADPDAYRAMNPENGWGDYESALDFMREFLAACVDHSDAVVEMWL